MKTEFQKTESSVSQKYSHQFADEEATPSHSGLLHPQDEADSEITDHSALSEFKNFISGSGHPCVGAAAALNRDEFWLGNYHSFCDNNSTQTLARDLFRYLQEQERSPKSFATFLATFNDEGSDWSEEDFEKKLWRQLSMLDQISSVFFPWDASVESDPASSKFSFSFGGKAFYVVGLHPNSSRKARAFKYPTLVFNLHSQFEELRASGKYSRMRDTIRGRDQKLQGSVNPMMLDFGSGSEAKQYSGRAVDESWRCPFHTQSTIIRNEEK